jgi:hypothetical protein
LSKDALIFKIGFQRCEDIDRNATEGLLEQLKIDLKTAILNDDVNYGCNASTL